MTGLFFVRFVLIFFFLYPLSFILYPVVYGQNYTWAELDFGASCGVSDGVYKDILKYLTDSTSVTVENEKKVLKLSDEEIFQYPFIILSCRAAPRSLEYDELHRLRMYLISGGTLFINDALGLKYTEFSDWVKRTVKLIFPETDAVSNTRLGDLSTSLLPMKKEHPVLRSFFLINGPAGRFSNQVVPDVVNYSNRSVIIYSKNDLLGVWAKDGFGKYMYPCVPQGETQRQNAQKLIVNIIIYSLTGSYKLDAVHQPFIIEKLRILDSIK